MSEQNTQEYPEFMEWVRRSIVPRYAELLLREQVARMVWEHQWCRPDDPDEEHIPWQYALEHEGEFGVDTFHCYQTAGRIMSALAPAPEVQP